MDVKITQDGNKFSVVLNGRLDTTNAEQFSQDIQVLMNAEKPEIMMDCTGMEYTSSQGLRMFLSLQKSVMAHQGSLVLSNMDSKVKEVFDITGFSNIIKII